MLFGGYSSDFTNPLEDDTWEWDGVHWVERDVTGPTGRHSHAMAFDSLRGVIVLTGGFSQTSGEIRTWEFNGDKWMFRSHDGPAGRAWHSMAFDSNRGVTVLYGGADPFGKNTPFSDTWEWNGTTWSLRATTGPTLQVSAPMAFDSGRGVTVERGVGTWEWDGNTWTQRQPFNPLPAGSYRMVYDIAGEEIVLFGSSQGGPITLLGNPQDDTWQILRAPPDIVGPPMAYNSDDEVVVMISAGMLHRWSGSFWTRITGANGPTGVENGTLAYDTSRKAAVYLARCCEDRFWEWDGATWSSKAVPNMPGGFDRQIAYFEPAGSVVLVANPDQQTFLSTWSWDGSTLSLLDEESVPMREKFKVAYDGGRQVIVLYGGHPSLGNPARTETWEWNGTQWSREGTEGPVADERSAMAYDAVRHRMVLINPYEYPDNVWEWDGSEWLIVGNQYNPFGRRMAFDAGRGEMVAYGGYLHGDTWTYGLRTEDDDLDLVADACDTCPETIPAIEVDEEGCPPFFAGDGNRDGDIDLSDALTLQNCFGESAALEPCAAYDANSSNVVDAADLPVIFSQMQGPDFPAGN